MSSSVARRVTRHSRIAPRDAVGWTHVWGEGRQVRLNDGQAYVLVMLGMIVYSPEDGPNARVYRCCDGVSIDRVERSLCASDR